MKMTNYKRYPVVTLLTLTICSAAHAQPANTKLKKLFEVYHEESLHFDPILETDLGDHRFDDQVANNNTVAYLKEKYSFDRKYLKLLKEFDFQKLNTDDQISYGYLKEMLSTDLQASTCHFEYMPFTQFISLPVDFGQLGQGNGAQPFKTPEQYFNMVKARGTFYSLDGHRKSQHAQRHKNGNRPAQSSCLEDHTPDGSVGQSGYS